MAVKVNSPRRYCFMETVELVKNFEIWQISPYLDVPITHDPK